jgi:uncharacterized protein YndB with AHSA1/START domain
MMTWLVRIVIGLVVIGVIVFIVGSLLPQNHTASRTAHFSQTPETVWAAITDVAAFPSWRSEVESVVQLAPQNDKPVWRETSHRGESITYASETWEPPRHLVTRITDKNLPFGGSWDYALSPSGTGSTLTITEHGEIYNPVFKVVSRFMSKTATMDAYLGALKAKLGSG